MDVIREIIDNDTSEHVRICLKSTYFSFCGDIYKQIEDVAMPSPLSLVWPVKS